MDDRDTRATNYSNNAMFASLTLRLLGTLEAKPNLPGKEDEDGGGLPQIQELLTAAQDGAALIAGQDEILPFAGSTAELPDYDLVQQLKPELDSPAALQKWAGRMVNLLETLMTSGWNGLEPNDRTEVRDDLQPFLEDLAGLEGTLVYETEETDAHTVEI